MKPDPLLLHLKIDLLENIIDYAGDIKKCSDSITSQIREIIGSRVVALFERSPIGDYSLLSACPERKADIFEKTLTKRLIARAGLFDHAVLVLPGEGETGRMITELGLRESFFVPLRVGGESFGFLVLLDLMDHHGVDHILRALQDISGLLSLVFKNSFLYRNMEVLAERRTSELMASESRSRIILQTAMDGFWRVDGEGKLLEVNDAYCAMVGYARDELLTMTIGQLDTSQSAAEVEQHIGRVLSGKKSRFETKHRHKDGSEVSLEICAQVHLESHPPEMVVFIRDITERKQLEEERRQMRAQIQHADKMESIGTLAGGIAHDFNNILGAIIGYSEMIREDSPLNSTIHRDIQQVIKAGNRAKELVKQILTFSRQTGIQKVPMQPATIVKEVVKLLRSSLPTTITIEQDIDRETGTILADPNQMHQILMNLCTNAFHAMEVAGGSLTISLQDQVFSQAEQSDPGNFVQLSIRDTGEGIDANILQRIYDPYFTTKEVGKGTGMGLAMVHGIVQSYGGSIICESRPGEGTVFHIYLPAIEEPPLQKILSAEQPSGGNEHILFIDDEPMLVGIGRTMLMRLGYQVTTRVDSTEALVTFQNDPDTFDLVISDLTMPGMTGIDLARGILQIRPKIPIILCTGYSSLMYEERARSIGITTFIMKPFSIKEMAGAIRKLLD